MEYLLRKREPPLVTRLCLFCLSLISSESSYVCQNQAYLLMLTEKCRKQNEPGFQTVVPGKVS